MLFDCHRRHFQTETLFRLWGWMLAAGLAAGCTDAEPPPPAPEFRPGTLEWQWFSEATAASGIDFTFTSGRSPPRQILEVKGAGLALVDFDADGDLDVFIPNGATLEDPESGPGCRLFENLGELKFRDATSRAAPALRRWCFGAAVADIEGDGFDDIYVSCYGPDVLLRNEGGRFVEATSGSGLANPDWSSCAAFADLDGDGDLDLVAVNYADFDVRRPPPRGRYMGVEVLGGPFGLKPARDRVFENLGGGRFREVTADWGFARASPAYGLNLAVVDFDDDGRIDVFVANDSMANHLFHNLGGGRFEEIGLESGAAYNVDGRAQASMGVAIADVDGNGRPDIFSTNFSSDTNSLLLQQEKLRFLDATSIWGLGQSSYSSLGWACEFADFDLDGDEDLLIFNGHVYPQAEEGILDASYRQRPLLYERQGKFFRLLGAETGGEWLGASYHARSAACGDLDGDGDVDCVFSERDGPLHVLRGQAVERGAAPGFSVELDDRRPESRNRKGLGSAIELDCGGIVQRRWLQVGGAYQSSRPPRAFFGGLPPSSSWTLKVRWPDGKIQTLTGRQDQMGKRRIRIIRDPEDR